MAVIDQDNFSNISWHSDQASGGTTLTPALEADDPAGVSSNGSSGRQATATTHGMDVDVDQLDPAGLGSEILECTVSSPIKENDGTKDAFVSYLITTNVCLPSSLLSRAFSTFARIDC
jgi:sorting nexin-4